MTMTRVAARNFRVLSNVIKRNAIKILINAQSRHWSVRLCVGLGIAAVKKIDRSGVTHIGLVVVMASLLCIEKANNY